MYSEGIGICAIVLGGYVATHPMKIRSYSSPRQWEQAPKKAKEKQRSYATAIGSGLIAVGGVAIVLGLLGQLP
jgi:hypothetical protein